jgi:lipopolysaccharide/colanic/teichoic acid biosynthesis glycosyltransferase
MNLARRWPVESAETKDFDGVAGGPCPLVLEESRPLRETGEAPTTFGAAGVPKARTAAARVKSVLDFCTSLGLIVLLSPLFLVVGILVKFDSKGPVLFFQRRCGKGGRQFLMLKFRTMVRDAEARRVHLKNEVDGPMFKVAQDPRVTRIGRYLRMFSLDELPQLVNVLRGEMSLVGPRPLAREEMSLNRLWMETRLSVKPGLTGLWQIKGRATRQFSDWVRYDIEYVERQSLLGDLKILLLTLPAVLRRRGAV